MLAPAPEAASDLDPVCPRCGTFATLRKRFGRPLCGECIERLRHDIERRPATAAWTLRGGIQLFREVGLPATAISLVVHLPGIVAGALFDVPLKAVVGLMLVELVATGAVIHLGLEALRGPEREGLLRAVVVSLASWSRLVAAWAISSLIICAYALFFVVPGILKACSFALAEPVVIAEKASGHGSIERSATLMKGRRWVAFAIYLATVLPTLLLSSVLGVVEGATAEASSTVTASVGFRLAGVMLEVSFTVVGVVGTLALVVLYAKAVRAEEEAASARR